MPTPTRVALATTTLTSATSAVTFSSIPNTYRDLILVVSSAVGNTGAPGGNARNLLATINGDGGTVYSRVVIGGDGAAARFLANTERWLALDWYAHSNNGTHVHAIQFFDYAQTDKHKTVLCRSTSTNATEALALRWPSTSAITTISVLYDQNTLAAGSTFSLYGVA